MNHELERMRGKGGRDLIIFLSRHLPGGTEETFQMPSHDNRSSSRDLNMGSAGCRRASLSAETFVSFSVSVI
jgi:hypothetical protein